MKMIINGQKTDASNKAVFDVINPANHRVIDSVPFATPEDIELALQTAEKGYSKWANTPLCDRADVMKKFHVLLKEHLDEVTDILAEESGKVRQWAYDEVVRGCGLVEAFVEASSYVGGDTFAQGARRGCEHDLILTVREPLGIVAAIVPFNYPVEIMIHKVVPALLMGNAVIVKPASDTPLANIRCVELLLEAGVPGDVLQIITGGGGKIGNILTSDPRIRMVAVTGSTAVGRQIAANASAHLTHVQFELGGNDSLVILADADLDEAVENTISSRLVNCGQTCCATKRVIVDNKIKDKFVAMLVEKMSMLKIGDPRADSTVDCGPLISASAAQGVKAQVEHTIAQGGKLICGGNLFNENYFEPTIIEVTPEMDIAQNMEIFGPVWPILGFDTVDEAIEISNNTEYGLSGGVYGKDMKSLLKVARGMRTGACIINGSGNYRTPDQGFGGYNQSGIGKEGAMYSLHDFSEMKTIVFHQSY